MATASLKTAVVFRPKRHWKPKRRDRNIARRRKRKRWWRRNKHRLRMRRKKRQRMLKHNTLFKQWRKKRQREKIKRRMRFGGEGFSTLPQSWFVFRNDLPQEGGMLDIHIGYILDYDPDQEDLLIFDVDTNQEVIVGLKDFLTHSEFLEEADIDNFELILDQFYGGPEDDLDIIPDEEETPRVEFEAPMEEMDKKVAKKWLLQPQRTV